MLGRRLRRELWAARGQALAIAAVIAAGIALFVVMRSTMDSLDASLDAWYRQTRFGDVFASAVRAPRHLVRELEAVPGVAAVEDRIAAKVLVEVDGLDEPASVLLQSIPDQGARARLGDLLLRQGQWPERAGEVLASERFARANHLTPGDRILALINGRRQHLTITGLALSPEYTYAVRPGEIIPDERRFGILWMARRELGAAMRMEGAFNDLVVALAPGAVEGEAINRLDRLLEPYGGTGAVPRARQVSHWFLANELKQLKGSAAVIPPIFLAVAAFLLHVVLHRMVQVDRGQIAAMKAMGRSDFELAVHTLSWALAVALAGGLLGVGAGAWLGRGMTSLYVDLFNLPLLEYRLRPIVAVQGLAVGLIAAGAGALGAALAVLRLAPAEAMRPEVPGGYRLSLLERFGRLRLPQTTRMVLRHVERHPARTGVSILGIASGGALLVLGAFSTDAIEKVLDVEFGVRQRWDAGVTFVEPRSGRALFEIERLPGVLRAEPRRSVAARLRAGSRSQLTALIGLPALGSLDRVVDNNNQPVRLATGGVVLSAKLAEMLALRLGDSVQVEVLEGRRPHRELRVVQIVETLMGAEAWLEIGELRRFLGEGQTLSGVSLLVDGSQAAELYRRLEATPAVAAVAIKRAAIEGFRNTLAENLSVMRNINVVFASIIAFGVVYNAARISLAERERELATLRVLGFTRAEISSILLGELAVVAAIAAPLGVALGSLFAWWVTDTIGDTELYRLPFVVGTRTMAFSLATIVIATIVSALVVRRRLDRLDLIAVLKNRE